MPLLMLGVVLLSILAHMGVHKAIAAAVSAIFSAAATLRGCLAAGMAAVVGWLKRSQVPEPRFVPIALLLAAASIAVGRADYLVLTQSFELILPSEMGGTSLLAFSMVALTIGSGVLAHSVARRLHRIPCVLVAALLITAQAFIAYTRTEQLDRARALVEAPLSSDDTGSLVIAGQETAQSAASAPARNIVVDRRGAAVSALITGLLAAAQVLLAWGCIHLGGSALAWAAASPVLFSIALPWLTLRVLLSEEIKTTLLGLNDALHEIVEQVRNFLARVAPHTWTIEASEYRAARQMRATMAKLDAAEHEAAALFRAEVEDTIRASERDALAHFLKEYKTARSQFFRHVLDEALKQRRAGLGHMPERIVRLWNWPLQKVWRLLLMLGGEDDPSLSANGNKSVTEIKEKVQ